MCSRLLIKNKNPETSCTILKNILNYLRQYKISLKAKMNTLNEYFDFFHTNPELINRIFSETTGSGNLYCDMFYQSAKSQTIMLEDNNVSRASSSFESGVGIRVVDDDRTG
ncbi:hypothetical protein J7K93_11500, partial [bacterium]|nr:hypothetical protein [bacterium]